MSIRAILQLALVFYAFSIARSSFAQHDARQVEENYSYFKAKGKYYSDQSNPDSAILNFKESLVKTKNADSLISSYLLLSDEYRKLSEFNEAESYVDKVSLMLAKPQANQTKTLARLLHLQGKINTDKGNFDKALTFFNNALHLIDSSLKNDIVLKARVLNYKGINLYFQGNLVDAMDNYRLAMVELQENNLENIDLADVAQNIGILYTYEGRFDSAVFYINYAKRILENTYKSQDPRMIKFYINNGRILSMIGEVNQAYYYYSKAENIMNIQNNRDELAWGHLMVNLGIYMQLSNDYNRALLYYQNAKNVYDRLLESDHPMAVTVANNLSNIYIHFGDYQQALNLGLSTLKKARSPITKVQLMRNIARSYLGLKDTTKAMNYIHQALQTAIDDLGENHFETANSYVFLAETEMQLKNYDDAFNQYAKAKKIFIDIFSFNDTEVADVLEEMAMCKTYTKQFDEADVLMRQAEKVLINESDTLLSGDNNPTTSSLTSVRLVDIYFWWGTLYHRWYESSNEISKLKNALAYFQKAMKLYDQLGYAVSDESRLLLNQNAKVKFNEAVDVAYALYKKTANTDYIDIGFAFAEKSKSAVLLSIMRKSEALIGAGVSKKMADQDHKLREEIAVIQKLIYEEHQKSFPNQNRINYLQTRQLSLVNSYDSLIGAIKSSFPDYYRLAFDNRVVDLAQVQLRVDYDQHVVEYVLGDSALVIFDISRDAKNMVRITDGVEHIKPSIQQMIDQLNPDFSNLRQTDFLSFAKTSEFLYQKLVAPVQDKIIGKRLLIIPDGVLGYLPYELLITGPSDSLQGIDYGELKYFLRDHAISYDYSATLRFGELFQTNRGNGEVLAVVPDYKDFGAFDDAGGRNISLPDLPFAMLEAQKTLQIADGKLLAGENATKARFEKEAKSFSILHLAMHTIIDDENPLYSRLVFQQTSDSLDAFSLGTFELFGLKLSADLAVLSACKTGSGKLMQGEGVMSMTRGFVYAGVNAIVMTNWEVHDQSGAQLMQLFYQYLSEGDTKDVAIQKARIDFLQTANNLKSHPYFWASYMLIGDSKPVSLHHKNTLFNAFVIIIVLIAAFLIWMNAKVSFVARIKKRKSASE